MPVLYIRTYEICGHKEPMMLQLIQALGTYTKQTKDSNTNKNHVLEVLSLTWPIGSVHHTLLCVYCKMDKIGCIWMEVLGFCMHSS